MFTDRFITLPIHIADLEKSEKLGIKHDTNQERESFVKLIPMQIESYRPAMKPDQDYMTDDFDMVFVRTKNGDEFSIWLTFEEFEKKLNEFDK